ncbi:hypothetical protein [Bacillus sp. OR-18]|uniref:hypothetical protein n=1 Tax=Bacillus sp. OR-18 TaxID=3029191 RepID=UPI00259F61FB|nr:hypothetical protein [Bacillus sp. OR-18]MDM5038902.1 hypothetical protein [Bacillus sp. OR-18]
MAVIEFTKIIAIKSASFTHTGNTWDGSYRPPMNLAYQQSYEIEKTRANELIANGLAIDYATALTNPKCPPIIRTKAIRIG